MNFVWASFKKLIEQQTSRNYIFKNCAITQDLSRKEIHKITPFLHTRTYLENEIVFEKNDPAKALYIICNGEVMISSGESSSIAPEYLSSLDFFGEVGTVLKNELRTVTAKCTKQSLLLTLTQGSLHDLAVKHPRIANKIYANLAFIFAYKLKVTTAEVQNFNKIVAELKKSPSK